MEDEWVIRPGERVGPITASSTADDLRRAFGDDALLIDPDLATGTGLIPRDDPGSMLDITWRDPRRHAGVASVRAAYGKFQWRTNHGLHHGMALAEVAHRNGGELAVGAGGRVVGPAGLLVELGRTLFLALRGAPSTLPDTMLRRYLGGPDWAWTDPSMQPIANALRLVELKVLLELPA